MSRLFFLFAGAPAPIVHTITCAVTAVATVNASAFSIAAAGANTVAQSSVNLTPLRIQRSGALNLIPQSSVAASIVNAFGSGALAIAGKSSVAGKIIRANQTPASIVGRSSVAASIDVTSASLQLDVAAKADVQCALYHVKQVAGLDVIGHGAFAVGAANKNATPRLDVAAQSLVTCGATVQYKIESANVNGRSFVNCSQFPYVTIGPIGIVAVANVVAAVVRAKYAITCAIAGKSNVLMPTQGAVATYHLEDLAIAARASVTAGAKGVYGLVGSSINAKSSVAIGVINLIPAPAPGGPKRPWFFRENVLRVGRARARI